MGGVSSAVFRERALLHCTTLFRGQRSLNNISMPRSAQASPSNLLLFEANRPRKAPDVKTGRAQWRICFCGAHELFLSLAQNHGFCRQGVPAALFREQALSHYTACCADNRTVILSRRACGASKNLLRLPQSSCNAIMPVFLYTKPYCNPARSFDFVPHFSLGASLMMAICAACLKRSLSRTLHIGSPYTIQA